MRLQRGKLLYWLLILILALNTVSHAQAKPAKTVLVIYKDEKAKNRLALLLRHFNVDIGFATSVPKNVNDYQAVIYLAGKKVKKIARLAKFNKRLLLLPGHKDLLKKWLPLSAHHIKLKNNIFVYKNIYWLDKNPLTSGGFNTAYLTLADFLHDFLNEPHQKQTVKVLVRIEDVHPRVDLKRLKQLIDLLYLQRVPFALSVIPVYKASPKAKPVYGSKVKAFKQIIKYAQTRGGTIIVHGYTHQLIGKTGVDAEFWNLKTNKPISPKAARLRAKSAYQEMQKMGVKAKVWETPHYLITETALTEVEKYFPVIWQRVAYLPLPYLSKTASGNIILPENAGYVSTKNYRTNHIVKKVTQLKLVRDSVAGFFYHPFLPVYPLAKTVKELKQKGAQFISLNRLIGEKEPPIPTPSFLDQFLFSLTTNAQELLNAVNLSFFTVVFFVSLLYYLILIYLFNRNKKQDLKPGDEPNLFFIFIIPALNEELVIKKTVKYLLRLEPKNYLVLVVDDQSTDNTYREVSSLRSPRLHLLQTPQESCRQGKGQVLNYAYKKVSQLKQVQKYSRHNVILGVIDADGRVEPNILETVSPYFREPAVGAVQVGVKIGNENSNLFTRWQDYEFQVFCFIFQNARNQLGSVGLGGNGQFIRLSALDSLGPQPWNDCLTEDLDIGLRLLLQGWQNRYCHLTYVVQQGLPEIKPLLRQRTRWIQGHFTCWRYLGKLINSNLNFFTKLDIAYYLVIPATVFWFIPVNYAALFYLVLLAFKPALLELILNMYGYKIFLLWYLLWFPTIPYFAYVYQKATRKSFLQSFLLAHLFVFLGVIWLIAAYKAIYRLAKGRTNWIKTPRVQEAA